MNIQTTTQKIEVVVESDYDNYFFNKVNGWVETKIQSGEEFKHYRIVITAGPYRAYAVGTKSADGVLQFDFYSALRSGFGSISDEEIDQLITML